MTEIEVRQENLHAQMEYARAVSVANMLPDAYRGKPADIMIAVGLGQSMGLSPAESLYRIAVVKGKPTASAELIAANVRKAGHRLRVSSTDTAATCTIIRADDPDYAFTVTRDMDWAQRMGLAGNDNYKKQAGTMLQWRAITACARLACPEALYGVAYTPDEMGDVPTVTATSRDAGPTLPDRMAEILAEPDVVDAEVVPDEPTHEGVLLNTRSNLAKALYASINAEGIPEPHRITFVASAVGRPITSTKELTKDEARDLLDNMVALAADYLATLPKDADDE